MSRPLKKTIKNTGIIKVNKKVRTFTDKSDPILLKFFHCHCCKLISLRSYKITHSLHKHEQLHANAVFRSGRNEFYNQNILHC